MNKRTILLVFFVLSLICISCNSQDIWKGFEHLVTPVRNYVVYQSISEINVDGKPTESSWKQAVWSDYFQDIEGDLKPEPLYQTRFKMLWDNENLYILAELEEPHVWAYYDTHDQIVFHENDFEIFIDPDRDTHNYFEFELNAQNTLFDLFLPKPYRNGGPALIDWDAKGFKSAIFIDGSLNNPSDTDKKWTIEVAIPFKVFNKEKMFQKPVDGDFWKINFSRVQWQTEIIDGKYQRKTDTNTDKRLSENNWVWSAQGLINMHYPERWGIAQFSTNKVDGTKVGFIHTEEEELAKYLWLIYYKQQNHRRKTGEFASSFSKLELPSNIKTENNKSISFTLNAEKNKFSAFLTTQNETKFSINQYGLVQQH